MKPKITHYVGTLYQPLGSDFRRHDVYYVGYSTRIRLTGRADFILFEEDEIEDSQITGVGTIDMNEEPPKILRYTRLGDGPTKNEVHSFFRGWLLY